MTGDRTPATPAIPASLAGPASFGGGEAAATAAPRLLLLVPARTYRAADFLLAPCRWAAAP